jgi:hypothetical protein
MKLRISHAVPIVAEVFGAFPCLIVFGAVAIQLLQERFQATLVEFVITLLNPFLALFAVGIDDLSNFTEVLFGVKSI